MLRFCKQWHFFFCYLSLLGTQNGEFICWNKTMLPKKKLHYHNQNFMCHLSKYTSSFTHLAQARCPCLWLLPGFPCLQFIILSIFVLLWHTHFPFPVQNKPLPAEAAVFILQKEVCREDSWDKTQSWRWEKFHTPVILTLTCFFLSLFLLWEAISEKYSLWRHLCCNPW